MDCSDDELFPIIPVDGHNKDGDPVSVPNQMLSLLSYLGCDLSMEGSGTSQTNAFPSSLTDLHARFNANFISQTQEALLQEYNMTDTDIVPDDATLETINEIFSNEYVLNHSSPSPTGGPPEILIEEKSMTKMNRGSPKAKAKIPCSKDKPKAIKPAGKDKPDKSQHFKDIPKVTTVPTCQDKTDQVLNLSIKNNTKTVAFHAVKNKTDNAPCSVNKTHEVKPTANDNCDQVLNLSLKDYTKLVVLPLSKDKTDQNLSFIKKSKKAETTVKDKSVQMCSGNNVISGQKEADKSATDMVNQLMLGNDTNVDKTSSNEDHVSVNYDSQINPLQIPAILTPQKDEISGRYFTCPYRLCQRKFKYISHFKYHLNTHMEAKQCQCEVCGKTFYTRQQLDVHSTVHNGIKNFSCDQCGKSFTTAGNLKTHARIHSGEKPYHCDECDKRFAEVSSLKKHKRVHTGEKPYICHVCGKGFTQSSSRALHMKKHPQEDVDSGQTTHTLKTSSSNMDYLP